MLDTILNLLNVFANIVTSLIYILGVYVILTAARFVGNEPEHDDKRFIDKSAGWLSFLFVIWAIASQRELVAEKLPFVSKDLGEYLGIRKDDGHV